MTDRWGSIREHDSRSQYLIGKPCHNVDSVSRPKTCSLRYDYNQCGCACPFFHMETQKLGEQLMKACRDWEGTIARTDPDSTLSPWEFSIHQRDEDNHPAYTNFPPVRGLADLPRDCVDRGASRQSNSDSRSATRINAVNDNTQATVDRLIQEIISAWEAMPH